MKKQLWDQYTWLTVNEAADYLGLEPKRIRSWVKEGSLLVAKATLDVPGRLVKDFLVKTDTYRGPLDSLPGTITLLFDGGFTNDEAVEWLLSPDETLGQSPLEALRAGKKHQVRRIAAALAL